MSSSCSRGGRRKQTEQRGNPGEKKRSGRRRSRTDGKGRERQREDELVCSRERAREPFLYTEVLRRRGNRKRIRVGGGGGGGIRTCVLQTLALAPPSLPPKRLGCGNAFSERRGKALLPPARRRRRLMNFLFYNLMRGGDVETRLIIIFFIFPPPPRRQKKRSRERKREFVNESLEKGERGSSDSRFCSTSISLRCLTQTTPDYYRIGERGGGGDDILPRDAFRTTKGREATTCFSFHPAHR